MMDTTKRPKKCFKSVQSSWFKMYIGTPREIFHHCYMAEIAFDWKRIDKLEKVYNEEPAKSTVLEHGAGREVNGNMEESLELKRMKFEIK